MDDPIPDLAIFITEESAGETNRAIIDHSAPAAVEIKTGTPVREDLDRARYLALWERNVIPNPGTIVAMIDFMDQTPEAGMAAPAIHHKTGTLPNFGSRPSLIRTLLRSRIDISPPPPGASPLEVEAISSPVVIMRPEMLAETGIPPLGPGTIATLGRQGRRSGWHLYGLPGSGCRLENPSEAVDPALGFIDLCRYLAAKPMVDKRWFKR